MLLSLAAFLPTLLESLRTVRVLLPLEAALLPAFSLVVLEATEAREALDTVPVSVGRMYLPSASGVSRPRRLSAMGRLRNERGDMKTGRDAPRGGAEGSFTAASFGNPVPGIRAQGAARGRHAPPNTRVPRRP